MQRGILPDILPLVRDSASRLNRTIGNAICSHSSADLGQSELLTMDEERLGSSPQKGQHTRETFISDRIERRW